MDVVHLNPHEGITSPQSASATDAVRHGAPISAALAFVLGTLVLLVVLCVIAIATWTGYRNTVDLLRQKAEIMVTAAVDQIHIHLEAAERQARFIGYAIESGEVDPDEIDNFVAMLSGTLAATPQITSIGFVDRNLTLIAAERDEPAPVPIFAKLGHDATWRAMMDEGAKAYEGYWTKIIWRNEYETAQLTRREPVRKDNQYVGFVNVEVGIPSLSELIGDLESDFGLNAFILENRRHVVAHPVLQFGFPNLNRWHPVPLIREVGDPVLMGIWDDNARNAQVSGFLGAANGHAIDLGEETYVFVYKAENGFGGDWLVGSYLAASDVLKEIERLFVAIVACASIVALSLLLAVWLGRRISRPVRFLAEQSRRVRNLDFENTEPIPGSYIRELDDAAAAFNQMVDGLRERQMIRDLFGKYVPKSVVAELLRDKGKLNPRSVEATILFVDLAEFTSLSEGLAPRRIVDILNAYFSGAVEIIEKHGGVITQFQGDAILSVYNVPIGDSEHAQRAVNAGIEIRKFVDECKFDRQRLTCRIGINTGEVVAGNVGARDRLNYTVHGDAVNCAARLEELNKELGTSILISSATAERIRNIEIREIGATKVRGKKINVRVFAVP